MIEIQDKSAGNFLWLKLTGKLKDEDYKQIIPQLEEIIEAQGKVHILLELEDFHGWDVHAAWDDFRFVVKHRNDIERVALVGDKKWQEWMARLGRPFVRAQQQYFDKSQIADACSWLEEEYEKVH